MKQFVVPAVAASILAASLIGMPSNAQAQVVIIIGNGSAQSYYPPPYPYPYPRPYPYHVVYGGGGYYPWYGYRRDYYRPYDYGYQPYDYGYQRGDYGW